MTESPKTPKEKKVYRNTPEKNATYYNKFKEKNKERLKETVICEICEGKYQYYNKYHHNKTKKHVQILKILAKHMSQLEPPCNDDNWGIDVDNIGHSPNNKSPRGKDIDE